MPLEYLSPSPDSAVFGPGSVLSLKGGDVRFKLGAVVTNNNKILGVVPGYLFRKHQAAEIQASDGTVIGSYFRDQNLREMNFYTGSFANYSSIGDLLGVFELNEKFINAAHVQRHGHFWPRNIVFPEEALGGSVSLLSNLDLPIGRVSQIFGFEKISTDATQPPSVYRDAISVEASLPQPEPAVLKTMAGAPVIFNRTATLGIIVGWQRTRLIVCPLSGFMQQNRLFPWKPEGASMMPTSDKAIGKKDQEWSARLENAGLTLMGDASRLLDQFSAGEAGASGYLRPPTLGLPTEDDVEPESLFEEPA